MQLIRIKLNEEYCITCQTESTISSVFLIYEKIMYLFLDFIVIIFKIQVTYIKKKNETTY